MNGWKEVLKQLPVLGAAWDILIIVVPLALLLAYSGVFFVSVAASVYANVKRRTIFDKCARQLALLGVGIGWTLLVGGRVWLYLTVDGRPAGGLANFMLETSWILLSIGVLLSSIYYTLWKILKNMPTLRATIGAIGAAQNCLALVCLLVSVRLVNFPPPTDSALILPDLFPDAWNDPLWSAACAVLPLIFAYAGAFGAVWLALRRKRDDFGRDYYNRTLPWLSAWARNSWLLFWLILLFSAGVRLWESVWDFQSRAALIEGGQLLLWALPLLLWTYVCKSAAPLRARWALYLALLFAFAYALPFFQGIRAIVPDLA